MAKLLYNDALNHEISELIRNAYSRIDLFCPYIKLHQKLKDDLKKHIDNYEIQINILFGKNEDDPSKSMSKEDFEFFKQFKHIQIRYEPRLHAKYYANDDFCVLSSMNLHGYSQNNNIEVGVKFKGKSLVGMVGSLVFDSEDMDYDAYKFFQEVYDNSEVIFRNSPQFENKILSKNKYLGSVIEIDRSSEFYDKIDTIKNIGYCISTGEKIEFDIIKPLSKSAYKHWASHKNKDNPEKFCHFTGEPSNGETSFNKPILRKNYRAAKDKYAF